MLYICADENTVPVIIERYVRRTIYMPLIVETKGNWEKAMSK